MAVEATAPRELDPVARFEATRADYLRYKRFYTALFWVGFLACLTLAIVQTGFDIFKIIEALPRSSSFIVKSYSALSWDNFWHDLKDWYWGFGKWFDALLVSLMMAFTATVVGTTVGGLLSFIASRVSGSLNTAMVDLSFVVMRWPICARPLRSLLLVNTAGQGNGLLD